MFGVETEFLDPSSYPYVCENADPGTGRINSVKVLHTYLFDLQTRKTIGSSRIASKFA